MKLKRIDSIKTKLYSGKVYDLTVENTHSYNINGIAVHNSLCETRIRAGVGIPMISSVRECVGAMDGYPYFEGDVLKHKRFKRVPISSNGGITTPGDMAKAIGVGANTVILGSLLSGTKETPGSFKREGKYPNEQLYKEYRGSASLSSKLDRGESNHIEGNSVRVLSKGSAKRILKEQIEGLKSAMSYVGADNIEDFQAKCDFIRITSAGQVEAKPHLMK